MIAFDIRSIILFRVCFGLYILYDILYTRLGFRWSLDDLLSPSSVVDYHIPWYTQHLESSSANVTSSTIAYLHVSDTPHQSYPHKIWFYRGSATFQYVLYTITCVLAICYSFGFLDIHSLHHGSAQRSPGVEPSITKTGSESDEKNSGVRVPQDGKSPYTNSITSLSCLLSSHSVLCKCIFWLLVTSYQNRNTFVHDGSDTYTRLILLYSCFIPLRFPKDVYPTFTIATPSQTSERTGHAYSISSISTTSFSVQIALMYLGTVCCRTVDRMDHPTFWSFWHPTNEWLLPSLSAVYNALCIGNFATRDNYLTQFICSHYRLCQVMTFSAMLIEFYCPIIGLLLLLRRSILEQRNSDYTGSITLINNFIFYASILPLLLLHFGLLCCLRLPNWQLVGMIALLPWVPTSFYDRPLMAKANIRTTEHFTKELASYKKTDGDPTQAPSTALEVPTHYCHHHYTVRSPSIFIRCLQYFFFFYMIYNFCAERRIIPKYDQGDIGEFFRISQYWVMYSTVGTFAHTTQITGTISVKHDYLDMTDGNYTVNEKEILIDLLRFIATGGRETELPMPLLTDANLSLASLRSSVPYPTVRWERAWYTWSKDSYESQFNPIKKRRFDERLRFFGLALCQLFNKKEMNESQRAHFRTDRTHFGSSFSRKRRRHERLLQWILNQSVAEKGIHQQKDAKLVNLFLKEIEIRFQHLQVLQRQNVQIAAPDSVFIVPCLNVHTEET